MNKAMAMLMVLGIALGAAAIVAPSSAADSVGYCVEHTDGSVDCSNCHDVGDLPHVDMRCFLVLE